MHHRVGPRKAVPLTCARLVLLLAACVLAGGCSETAPSPTASATVPTSTLPKVESPGLPGTGAEADGPGSVKVTVVYDNTVAARPDLQAELRSDWGFACVVETEQTTVLFDTGSKGDVLLANLRALGIDPRSIDTVVLSHAHGDHTGGLAALLEQTGPLTVYHPASFSAATRRAIGEGGATSMPVTEPITIGPGLLVTGAADRGAKGGVDERALLVETAEGPLLITGCAHPGIVWMVEAASAVMKAPVRVALGGFHLMNVPVTEVADIAERLAKLGVVRCGPAHCTGEAAAAQLRRQFGAGFIESGTGAVTVFADGHDS
jgi:7,8-dihydropterin-6-yl-methyl-4-(beta-D-ribofuranosyl)aminobenzene 5'-phosphate synthase